MTQYIEPEWWPLWQAYKAAQREFEEAVEALAGIGPQADAGWTMERIRREIVPKRHAGFEAFRSKYAQR